MLRHLIVKVLIAHFELCVEPDPANLATVVLTYVGGVFLGSHERFARQPWPAVWSWVLDQL